MKEMKTIFLFITVTLFIGCNKKPVMPEVNDANCKVALIMKIEDKATRQEFAGLCSRRSGIRKTTNPLNWLELIR